jgi:hypothetical protein
MREESQQAGAPSPGSIDCPGGDDVEVHAQRRKPKTIVVP